MRVTASPSRREATTQLFSVVGYLLGSSLACESHGTELVRRPVPPVAAKYFDEVVRIADTHAERCHSLYNPEHGCRTYLASPGDAGPAPDALIDSPILAAAPELISLQVSCSWALPAPSSPPSPLPVLKPEDPPIGALCRFKPMGEVPVPFAPKCHGGKPYSSEWTGNILEPSENVLVPYDDTCEMPWVEVSVNRNLDRPGSLIRVKAVFTP